MVLEHKEIQSLSDFFTELGKRREKGVYFYRINGYSEEIGDFCTIIMMPRGNAE